MTALKELQNNFKLHLVKGDENILPEICSTSSLSNVDRLAIYGNAYYLRLIEVLMSDYEAIHALLGDEQFDTLCREYINAYPSKFFSVRWFGQYLAEYLKTNEPYSQHEYLYEMARFEWLFTDTFDAADAAIVSESDVAQVPAESWPSLKITLHPSVNCFQYQWNILPVWKAVKENSEVPVLDKADNPETCMIWRQGLITKYKTLETNEAILIEAVESEKNFSEWCQLLVNRGETPDDVPMIAAGILKTWLGSGMITGLKYQD